MKLVKSSYNRVLTGVCGGIGNYFNLDPTVIRVLFAIATFITGGTVAILYLIMSFIIPSEYDY